jgi:predicted secreted Zn-dependent protease
MKRRSARQLVRLLSDIRHAAHCSSLRAAATNRAIALVSTEDEAQADPDDRTEDSADAVRNLHQTKPTRSGS